MLFKSIKQIPSFLAGDETILREVLHPDHDPVEIPYSLAQAAISPGKASLAHRLKSGELYIFQSGEGIIWVDGVQQKVVADDLVYVPPGAEQYVENTGSQALQFFCIVAPAWKATEEQIEGK